jgi:Bacteriocin-protection, YdeI or OmpD-Associated
MKHHFSAKIYKVGINWCVDVPLTITGKMSVHKGYIYVKGKMNDFAFAKTLIPVKNSAYRLFVNSLMLKGGKTALGEIASFTLEQDSPKEMKHYPVPKLLTETLDHNSVKEDFENLTPSRKREILKYLSYLKPEETLQKNVNKLVMQLKNKEKSVRLP